MLMNLLSSRWFQGGLAFFVLVVGGSLLYSWNTLRTTKNDMERHARFLQRLEKENETPTAETMNVQNSDGTTDIVENPMEYITTHSDVSDGTLPNDAVGAATGVFLLEDVTLTDAPAEEVAVSPYGFGPYPELPAGWSPDTFPTPTAEHELLKRVRIKLISQGINAEGAVYGEHNLIYPIVKGTVYVEWTLYDGPAGLTKRIGAWYGHPADGPLIKALQEEARRTKGSFPESRVPSDIKLVPLKEGGINPYEFLNL